MYVFDKFTAYFQKQINIFFKILIFFTKIIDNHLLVLYNIVGKRANRVLGLGGKQLMFLKKLKCILCAAIALIGILLLSGCDSTSAELVDEPVSESAVQQEEAEITNTEVTTNITTSAIRTTVETETENLTESTTFTSTATLTETKAEITTAAAEITTEASIETTIEIVTEVTTETTTMPTAMTVTDTDTAEKVIAETTTEPDLTGLTPKELQTYNSMPDIVFVLSHCYDFSAPYTYTNIRGVYITKNGEVKLYAFSDEEERKYMDVAGVYDELKNMTCPELSFRGEGDEITQSDLDTVSTSDLIELYNELLLVDEKSEFEERENPNDAVYGLYKLYGIRTNKNGEKEIILLSLKGDYYRTNKDIHAQEINTEIYESISPFSYYRIL